MKTVPAKTSVRQLAALLILAAATSLVALPTFAQPKAAPKLPLDSFDDSRLMGEMANRGLMDLLDFYFKKTNVPPDKQKEITVMVALQHLDSRDFATKSAVDKKKEIDEIVQGINGLLPGITDSQILMCMHFR